MSDTPRTDAETRQRVFGKTPVEYVPADFARQLERELSELRSVHELCVADAGRMSRYIDGLDNAAPQAGQDSEPPLSQESHAAGPAVAAPTPITDAFCGQNVIPSYHEWAMLARQLERDLRKCAVDQARQQFDCHYAGLWAACDKEMCRREKVCRRRS